MAARARLDAEQDGAETISTIHVIRVVKMRKVRLILSLFAAFATAGVALAQPAGLVAGFYEKGVEARLKADKELDDFEMAFPPEQPLKDDQFSFIITGKPR